VINVNVLSLSSQISDATRIVTGQTKRFFGQEKAGFDTRNSFSNPLGLKSIGVIANGDVESELVAIHSTPISALLLLSVNL
jgi:predicted ATP-grasp superfamily ATP-dependent carboligase